MKLIAALCLLLASSIASADVSYNYVEVLGFTATIDDTPDDIDVRGAQIGGGWAAAEHLAILPYAAMSTADYGPADGKTRAFGADLVLHTEIMNGLQGEIIIGAADVSFEISEIDYKDSDTGTRGGVGLRYSYNDQMEIFAEASAEDAFGTGDNVFAAGLRIGLPDKLRLVLSGATQEDVGEVDVGLRYDL